MKKVMILISGLAILSCKSDSSPSYNDSKLLEITETAHQGDTHELCHSLSSFEEVIELDEKLKYFNYFMKNKINNSYTLTTQEGTQAYPVKYFTAKFQLSLSNKSIDIDCSFPSEYEIHGSGSIIENSYTLGFHEFFQNTEGWLTSNVYIARRYRAFAGLLVKDHIPEYNPAIDGISVVPTHYLKEKNI